MDFSMLASSLDPTWTKRREHFTAATLVDFFSREKESSTSSSSIPPKVHCPPRGYLFTSKSLPTHCTRRNPEPFQPYRYSLERRGHNSCRAVGKTAERRTDLHAQTRDSGCCPCCGCRGPFDMLGNVDGDGGDGLLERCVVSATALFLLGYIF